MALFSKKTAAADAKVETKAPKGKAPAKKLAPSKSVKNEVAALPSGPTSAQYIGLLTRPRITEKSTMVAMNNVYTFNVSDRSNKKDIAKANHISEDAVLRDGRKLVIPDPPKR